ncbi:MAG: sulfotransferase, partial [Synechococcaceae cyanobacterium]|nr:sulfotransferase [Synechococcaceae cyanobacterium]
MSAAPEAVFIGGCPRSGTTLLASLLGGLPGCVVTPESQFKQSPLRRLHRDPSATLAGTELLSQWRRHFRFRQWQVPLEPADLPGRLGFEELRRLLLELVRRSGARQGLAADAPITWIDHTPQNIEIGLALSHCFPGARLIEIVRDPRAVAASLLPLDWGPMAPAGVAALWSHRLAHGLALQQALGERIRRVRYEDL